MREFSTEQKLCAGFGVAVVAVLIMGTVAHRSLQELLVVNQQLLYRVQVASRLDDLMTLVLEGDDLRREFLRTGDVRSQRACEANARKFTATLERIRELTPGNPYQRASYAKLESLVEEKMRSWNEPVAGNETVSGHPLAQEATSSPNVKTTEQIRRVLTQMEREEDEVLQARSLASQAAARRTTTLLLAGSILSAVIIGVALFVIYRDIERRRKLESQLLAVSEREQSRIGLDLHDDLSQSLTAIATFNKVLGDKLTELSLAGIPEHERVAQLLDEAIAKTRHLSRGLYPIKLEANGLMSALYELATMLQETPDVMCQFECPSPVLMRNNSTATHLYRIAQEACHNAVRHAKPTRILIRLAPTDKRIVLSIQDDGIGLPKTVPNDKGMGLAIMQYRAKAMGGSLEIRSLDHDGTTVICSVPNEDSPSP